ncbi:hypothetical protein O0L34_g11703 [Tuta absoluta]|nr:hypothetical protein O0L34_g11703 [Tuta absoluta]
MNGARAQGDWMSPPPARGGLDRPGHTLFTKRLAQKLKCQRGCAGVRKVARRGGREGCVTGLARGERVARPLALAYAAPLTEPSRANNSPHSLPTVPTACRRLPG